MGVRGLQSYMENHCPAACYMVNIRDLVDTYRRETGKVPVIVVDGSSCLRFLYGNLEWLLGGQLKEYIEKITKFVKAFQALGVKLVFFFDGATVERKRAVWIERRYRNLQDVYKIYDSLNRHKKLKHVDQSLFQLPAGLGSVTRFVFKNMEGCEVFTSIRECDEEIAEYARTRQCFAILGQDTDYIIYDGAQYYFSMMKLSLQSMTTLNYNRWALARHLSIHPTQLPILASLVGNDIITSDELKGFHIDICRRPDRGKYNYNSRIRFDILIKQVAEFIRTLPCGDDVFKVLPAVAHRVFRDERKAVQLDTSIRSYFIDLQLDREIKEEPRGDTWSRLMSIAKKRHIHCDHPSTIFAVMNGCPYESSTALEDFREEDLPSAALALRPLRQRTYWLILHEKPATDGPPIVVKEWCMSGENSLEGPASVKPVPVQGLTHPGLLSLWTTDNQDLKWRVFCAAVSPRLCSEQMREIPPHLVIPTALLTFLHHELEGPVLENWEVEALLILAVVLEEYSTDYLSKLEITNVHVRAIRISTLYLRGALNVKLLLGVCGFPVPQTEAVPWKYFDGKLFSLIYHKTKLGMKYEDHCLHKVSLMEQYLKVRHIVLGSARN